MLTVSRNNGNPIIFNMYTKSLNYVLNQKVDVKKRAKFGNIRYIYLRLFMRVSVSRVSDFQNGEQSVHRRGR